MNLYIYSNENTLPIKLFPLNNNVSRDSITSTYIFRFECHIVLSDYFIPTYLLSTNEAGHDGTLHDRFTERHDDIKILILL